MVKKALFSWLTGMLCLLVAGCGGVSVSLSFFDGLKDDRTRTLPFQEVTPIVPSAITQRRLVVVRDLTAWDALWREHAANLSPLPTMPAINFSQDMVIAIFLGARTDTCRDVEIQSIWQHSFPDRIEVNFREISQSSDARCLSGSSNPAKLVVLPYSFLPVEFFQLG